MMKTPSTPRSPGTPGTVAAEIPDTRLGLLDGGGPLGWTTWLKSSVLSSE